MSDLSVTNVEPDDPELVMDFTIEGRVHTIPMRIADRAYSGPDGLGRAWVLDEHAVWAMLQDHGVEDVAAVDVLWEYITFHTIDGEAYSGDGTLPVTDVEYHWALRRKPDAAPKSSRKSKMRRLNKKNLRKKNAIIDKEGLLPLEGKDVDEYERRATAFAYALIDFFEAYEVPYVIKFGLKGADTVSIHSGGRKRTSMLPSRYEFVVQTGSDVPYQDEIQAIFESTGLDEFMYYDGWESGSYGDDPLIWPSNFWYEKEDGAEWRTADDFATKAYGPRFMSPEVKDEYELVAVAPCGLEQYRLAPKTKRRLNALKRRLMRA